MQKRNHNGTDSEMNTHERNENMPSSQPQTETNPPVNPSRWDLTFLSQLSFNDLLYHVLFGGKEGGHLNPQSA
jgi:hypothetical protein